MRLTQEQIEVVAYRVVHELRRQGILHVLEPEELEATVAAVVTEDLAVEDRLNDEVREIMRAHDAEIRRADVEFHEMFRAIKARLARERNIIL